MMYIQPGAAAPHFSLFDSDRNKVSLADYKGKNVLLLFFPLAYSRVCTAELCSVRDNISLYNAVNAQVLGISVDSLYVLHQFKADQNLNFPLLSDFNKEAAKAYGVLYDVFPAFNMQGVSKRAAFVIDREEVVIHAQVCASPGDMPDFDAIQHALEGLN